MFLEKLEVNSSTKTINSVLDRLLSLASNLKQSVLVQKEGSLTVVKPLQVICGLRYQNKEEEKIHEIIISAAIKAEKMSPGSFVDCILEIAKRFRQHETAEHSVAGCYGKSPNKTEITNIIDKNVSCSLSRHSLMEALTLSGLTGKILIEKSSSNTMSVEQTTGYSFSLVPSFGSSNSLVEPKVLCIDGFIESVSEIHHLLQEASENKDPGVLFVRGLSDDVVHTLKTNFERGSLKIIPVIVRFDLEGINTLNDIAVVCGTDIVSSLKGQLISSVRWSDAVSVDSITVFSDKVLITNRSSQKSVTHQVSALLTKRSDQHDESVLSLLDKRIKSLTPNQVIIRIPDDALFLSRSQSIDYALRTIRNSIDYGILPGGELATKDVVCSLYSCSCVKMLLDLGSIL